MPLQLIDSILPKLCKYSVVQYYSNISEKTSKPTKCAIRIIFHENKFARTQIHFKEKNTLKIYQSSMFNNLLFLHRVENGKMPLVILS